MNGREDFSKRRWIYQTTFDESGRGKPYSPKADFWFKAPTAFRWFGCIVICAAALIVTTALFSLSLGGLKEANLPTDLSSLWSLGFGAVDPNALLNTGFNEDPDNAWTLMRFVLLANTPQLILSLLYFMYNGILTIMLVADEWSHYAYERRGLRTTDPRGDQRASYYLHLPFIYSVPLLIISGLFHWLVSQSFFLAAITTTSPGLAASAGKIDDFLEVTTTSITCGYSSIAIIFVLIVGILMVLALIGLGLRRFRSGMPLAISCSAAISAACHRGPDDANAAVLPVQWGAVQSSGTDFSNGLLVEHCTLSSRNVERPVVGTIYA